MPASPDKKLDVITIGRASVDLYGEQVGGRIEDMGSFAKYVGGCPLNIAVGTSRLGLKSALLTRVGADPFGRYLCETLQSEGVNTEAIVVDPERLTALAILGIRDRDTFPLLFYRENCADMALCEDDVSAELVASSRSVLITGTHLSTPSVRAASKKAVALARAQGSKVILDIDYRPVLWGLTAPEDGEQRFIANPQVTEIMQTVMPDCDLIVGTEEEFHILAGSTDTLEALKTVRANSDAVIVCKRGALGCVVFAGTIGEEIEAGIKGRSFSIEVFNVLGAGDAFMSGFLRGWLTGRSLQDCCTWANASGALVVSRHGCAPAIPSWTELQYFLDNGSSYKALRHDRQLEHIHWATNRKREYPSIHILAIDHRSQFEDMAKEFSVEPKRISRIKEMAMESLHQVANNRAEYGILLDGRFAEAALAKAADRPYWIGRPIELPGALPLEFEASEDVATEIAQWPLTHTVKCLVNYRHDDPIELRTVQEQQLLRLFDACRKTRHEFLLEVICSQNGTPAADGTPAAAMEHLYKLGIYPDWWKLEPTGSAQALAAISAIIDKYDPWCRGIVLLGLSAPLEDLLNSFSAAAAFPWVKGFAVGRTIWYEPALAWFKGDIDDEQCIADIGRRFAELSRGWHSSMMDAGRQENDYLRTANA